MIWLVNLPTQELKWINNEFRKRQVGLLQLNMIILPFNFAFVMWNAKMGRFAEISQNVNR